MTTRKRTVVGVAIAAMLAVAATRAAAQDWPQWRGPDRDGSVTGFAVPATWPAGLTEQWKVEVGFGYGSPLLIGDRVYLFTRQGDDEVMLALDAGSGETIWRTSYDASFNMMPATARSSASRILRPRVRSRSAWSSARPTVRRSRA